MNPARHLMLALTMAVMIVAAGCSRKDETAAVTAAVTPLNEPRGGVEGAPASPVATAAAAAGAVAVGAAAAAGTSTAQAAELLEVAFVYGGRVNDGGRAAAHERGRQEMAAALAGQVKVTYVESVPEGADAEPVFRELAGKGNKVIFGTAFGYGPSMAALAREFPEVKWEHATGAESGDNLRAYGVRAYQGAYLAGIIAGKITRTDTLGFVASVPIPDVVRNINAFTLGAQSVNPSVRTKIVWVNKWFDPGRESEAAQSLINGGADVLLQNTDSSAPLQVAERAGKFAFGWGSDMRTFGPKAHLGSSIVNWGPYYTKAVRQVLDGTWKPQSSWWGLAQGAVDLVSLSDVVPQDVKALVEEKKKAIADGKFRIWKGPMISSEDREVLGTGEIGDDQFISGIMFLVKGVEGKIPSGS